MVSERVLQNLARWVSFVFWLLFIDRFVLHLLKRLIYSKLIKFKKSFIYIYICVYVCNVWCYYIDIVIILTLLGQISQFRELE